MISLKMQGIITHLVVDLKGQLRFNILIKKLKMIQYIIISLHRIYHIQILLIKVDKVYQQLTIDIKNKK
jgi:hypothetical protein